MTFWLVMWISFSCPGGALTRWLGADPPEWAKPLICRVAPQYEIYSRKRDAYRQAESLACGPSNPALYWCKNLKCWGRKIHCRTVIEIENK